MLRLLFATLILISVSAKTSAEFDKARCADLVSPVSKLAEHVGDQARMFAQRDATFVTDTTGALNEAGRRADAARARVVAALREYQSSIEEVTYQLRQCAR